MIQMDADGQHDVCNISALYQALKTPDADGELPDIVLGARFMKGSPEFDVSLAKKIAFVLFRNMIRIGTGVHIMILRRDFGTELENRPVLFEI